MENGSSYTAYTGKILLPIQVVEVRFCEKEEVSLNPFQEFLLEAIEQDCSVSQIVDATLLTSYAIESEITQMISQKLLKRDGGFVELSELSRKILMVSRCVRQLNAEKKKACIDLITGVIENFDDRDTEKSDDLSGLEIRPKLLQEEIEGISIEENTDFFRNYMHTFDQMTDEAIDAVLSSVYIDLHIMGEKLHRARPIVKLPCLIGPLPCRLGDVGAEMPDLLFARGRLCKITYSLKSALAEENSSILSQLLDVAEHNAALLSDKGKEIVNAYQECGLFGREDLVCYYDYVSGDFQPGQPGGSESARSKTDFELPVCVEMTDNRQKAMMEKVAEYYGIPDGMFLEEARVIDESYVVSGALSDLLGDTETE